jgi:hypothetical protein
VDLLLSILGLLLELLFEPEFWGEVLDRAFDSDRR